MKNILSNTICECKYHIVMTILGFWSSCPPDWQIGRWAFGWAWRQTSSFKRRPRPSWRSCQRQSPEDDPVGSFEIRLWRDPTGRRFQNWSPLEREIGRVCVTNLKLLRLREIIAIRRKKLISLKFFITNVFAYVNNRFVVNMYFGIIKYNLSVWICWKYWN